MNEQLGDRIAYILNGGECSVGIESIIISFLHEQPEILRHGGIGIEAIEAVIGKVTDNMTKQPVVGAKIVISNTYKAISDFDGNYQIKDVPFGEHQCVVTMLSFDTLKINMNVNKSDFYYEIILGGSQEIEEMKVIGNLAQDRKTPVAVTTIGTKEITEELGSQDLPMILNSKPGVHATQQGGGDGDARITIRGFDQRNVGVMIDGVPVNDMENGWVYWSNWFGLDNITSQIQVQRGLGATKLAMMGDKFKSKRKVGKQQEHGSSFRQQWQRQYG